MALQDFITAANTYGFGKRYNFQVADIKGAPVDVELKPFLLYVETFTLPSRKTNTTTVPYKAFDFNVPTNASFPESSRWRVTFFSDEDLLIKTLFEDWSNFLYEPVNNYSAPGIYANPIAAIDLFNNPFERVVNYPRPRVVNYPFGNCELTLDLKNDKDETIKTITLYGVFPILVEGIEYNVGDNGETVARLPVTLAFQYFK